jgi:membrane protein DedA with SNARE-associated domain
LGGARQEARIKEVPLFSTDFLKALIFEHQYFAFAGVLVVAGFGVPIPEDIPLLIMGYLCSQGELSLGLTIVIAMGCILGADGLFYFIGRWLRSRPGEAPGFVKKYLTDERKAQVEKYFEKYGLRTIFVGRFLPGLRTPIFLFSGLWGVRPALFFLADGSAALLSVPALIIVGYLFGDNFDEMQAAVGNIEFYIIAGLVILFAFSLWLHYRKPKDPTATTKQVPEQQPVANDQ